MPQPTVAPSFLAYSEAEAEKHDSYLMVSTTQWAGAKGGYITTIEWRLRSAAADAESPMRVRLLAEREPLNAQQAREKAEALARRNGVPVVFTVVR